MRTIKYRALGTKGYTPTDGKWCYGSNVVTDYLGDDKKDNHFPLTIFERYLGGNYYDKNTRCQFTGLLDKNGVEIYDGDILAGCNGSINGTGWNWGNYSISFKNGKFDVPLWGTLEHHDSTHWFEVIGNIYEHPHLLEANND